MSDYLKQRERERRLEKIRGKAQGKRQLGLPHVPAKAAHRAQLGFGFNGDSEPELERLTLRIGKRHAVEVHTLAEASRVYGELRDESGEGASTFPTGKVGKYRISYNGRVWDGDKQILEAQGSEQAKHFPRGPKPKATEMGRAVQEAGRRALSAIPRPKHPELTPDALLEHLRRSGPGASLSVAELRYAFKFVTPQAATRFLTAMVKAGQLEKVTAAPGRKRVSREAAYRLAGHATEGDAAPKLDNATVLEHLRRSGPGAFTAAKAYAVKLEAQANEAGAVLRAIAGGGPMGLTPAHVRDTPEWREAKRTYTSAFSALQSFNKAFVKQFKSEIRQERRERSAAPGSREAADALEEFDKELKRSAPKLDKATVLEHLRQAGRPPISLRPSADWAPAVWLRTHGYVRELEDQGRAVFKITAAGKEVLEGAGDTLPKKRATKKKTAKKTAPRGETFGESVDKMPGAQQRRLWEATGKGETFGVWLAGLHRPKGKAPKNKAAGNGEPTGKQLEALREYACWAGPKWKAKLAADWMRAGSEWSPGGELGYHLLQQLRNSHGPAWLRAYELPEGKPRQKAGPVTYKEDSRWPPGVAGSLKGAASVTGDPRYGKGGGTVVWFYKPEHRREMIEGYDHLERMGILPVGSSPDMTHRRIGTFDSRDKQEIFEAMQGEVWSPRGEARKMIEGLGLDHTSMSIGDVIQIGQRGWLVDRLGFRELKKPKPLPKPRKPTRATVLRYLKGGIEPKDAAYGAAGNPEWQTAVQITGGLIGHSGVEYVRPVLEALGALEDEEKVGSKQKGRDTYYRIAGGRQSARPTSKAAPKGKAAKGKRPTAQQIQMLGIMRNAHEELKSHPEWAKTATKGGAHFGQKKEKAAVRQLVKLGLARITHEEKGGPEGVEFYALPTVAGLRELEATHAPKASPHDLLVRRVAPAFSTLADLEESITAHGYVPTLSLSARGHTAKERADIKALRALLTRKGHAVFPPEGGGGATAKPSAGELFTVRNSSEGYLPKAAKGRAFNLRVRTAGMKWGLEDKLTHEGRPVLEFYDATHVGGKFGPRGQYVADHYLETITDLAKTQSGLRLASDAAWNLDPGAVRRAAEWLEAKGYV